MFFNCGNSACPLLQFDKQQVDVEKRGDDWDNGRENKITQQEITTIKIDLSKTMPQKKSCCASGSEKSLLEESMQQVIWESGWSTRWGFS